MPAANDSANFVGDIDMCAQLGCIRLIKMFNLGYNLETPSRLADITGA
jgi:hypothetical protein